MRKLRDWFLLHFLPAWAKETVYKDNEELRKRNAELKGEISRMKAYTDGMEYVLRCLRHRNNEGMIWVY